MTKKKALITGISGQDGSYLAELLLKKGYIVHGIKRRSSYFNTTRIDKIYSDRHLATTNLFLHYGDMTDSSVLTNLIAQIRPDEIYNLAAQSHVAISFVMPEYTSQVDAIGTLRILEAIRSSDLFNCRFYQASTSELYGDTLITPQDENTPFKPTSPYAISKLYAYWMVRNYRDAYGLHASNGILFNHESPRRGENFVTRKITRGLARVKHGLEECIYLGNIDAKRDWGHAKDYVYAQWLITQQEYPDDYVIATGETRSVRDFCITAARKLNIDLKFKGMGTEEIGYDDLTGRIVIKIDQENYRPTDVNLLLGDPTKSKKILGWSPKISFHELVEEMIEEDDKIARREAKQKA